jgi:hypothetical protein
MAVPVTAKGYTEDRIGFWADLENGEKTPELLRPLNLQVYDRMRSEEGQVTSVLKAVTLPVRRTRWYIDPADARPEVARMVADDLGLPLQGEEEARALRTRDRFSWASHLYHVLLKLPFGHSYFEQVYRNVDGVYRLRKLEWRPPKSILDIKVASDGGLVAIKQAGHPQSTEFTWDPRGRWSQDVEIPVDRLVAHVNDREGGNWYGRSLLRPAYKFWLLKDRALRKQDQMIDRNGMGIADYEGSQPPEGMIDPDEVRSWQELEIAKGLEIATALRGGSNAGVSRPYGSKLNLMGVTGKLPDIITWIRYLDELIARTVLANFLNLGGDNSTGSYALGETFSDFFVQSLQTVAMDIADVTNQHVIEDMVDVNFGDQEPAPRLKFEEIGSRHPATAEALKLLHDAGLLTPDDPTEEMVRSLYGLPSRDPSTARTAPGGTE